MLYKRSLLEERWMFARYQGPGLSCRSERALFSTDVGVAPAVLVTGQWMNPGRQMVLTPRKATKNFLGLLLASCDT